MTGPKTVLTSLFTGLVVVIGLSATAWGEDDPIQENARKFMQAKLSHAQAVLDGLATEDYDKLAKSGQAISLLSQASQWQVIQTPEYVRRSAEFRRDADAITQAGRDKDLNAATLAYLKMTLSCVECHKYVRSVRDARLPPTPDVLRR